MGNWLIAGGIILLLLGFAAKSGLLGWIGHLPGDIRIEYRNGRFYLPITSMILISVVLSLFVNLFRRLF
ncbi:MAG: DUF2905 domain-containing protein [Proteobacteria bacterium]|nr:DUF2905 domain-containing protein [Pseudomonadota bacterium]